MLTRPAPAPPTRGCQDPYPDRLPMAFEPQGVTGLALLAESHISIHTWPESGYAAVDVFTCGDHTMPERACEVLAVELGASDHKLTSFRRETPAAIAGDAREPALAG